MKILTKDLIGPSLDWAVAKTLGYDCQFDDEVSGPWLVPQNGYLHDEMPLANFSPSTRNHTVIDLMEREKIGVIRCDDDYGRDAQGFTTSERIPVWAATTGQHGTQTSYEGEYYEPQYEISESDVIYGSTPRIAVCRCFVASKLGDEVEVPDELIP